MISSEFKQEIATQLSDVLDTEVEVMSSKPIGGGSINQAAMLSTSAGSFFIKWNDLNAFPGMFDAEKRGLELVSTGNHIRIPQVYKVGEFQSYSYLLMEWIEPGAKRGDFWEAFGNQLADLHRETHSKFGLDHDNYMGSLVQTNKQRGSWDEFFIENRLEPQLKMAKDNGFSFSHSFAAVNNYISSEFPKEQPALVHGDLWSGNFLSDRSDNPVLIDPAAYYGHREIDIAMSTLFGGFDPQFYEAYNENYPLENGWQERLDICNLYPLLVHVNLFGSGYVSQVNQILRKFS